MLSIPHLIIIFLVALIVLGPEKLPEVARVLGKTMADFRRITNDFRMQVEDEMRDLERQTREREIATAMNTATAIEPAATELPALPVEFTDPHAEPALHSEPADVLADVHAEAVPAEKPADGEPHPA